MLPHVNYLNIGKVCRTMLAYALKVYIRSNVDVHSNMKYEIWKYFTKCVELVPNLMHFEKKYKVLWFGPKLNALLIFFKIRCHNARKCMQLCMPLQSGSHTLGFWWAGSVTLTPAAGRLTVEQGGVKNVKFLMEGGRHLTRINSKGHQCDSCDLLKNLHHIM